MSKHNRVVVEQPAKEVWEYENPWHHSLTDCCKDCRTCACAFFCFWCYTCKLFKRTNECICMLCIPGSLMSLRAKLRTGFRIKGTLCRDFCATSCCPICAAIQMMQELDYQEL